MTLSRIRERSYQPVSQTDLNGQACDELIWSHECT